MKLMLQLLTIPAASAYFFNDILSLLSLTGTSILFLSDLFPASFVRHLVPLAEWYAAPLVFGSFFQVSFAAIGMISETERMGFLLPMSPYLVTGLFVLSFLLRGASWWLRRNASNLV
jgi:hypothetical protein